MKLPLFGGKAKQAEEQAKSSFYYAIDIGTEVLKVLLCQAKKSGVEVIAVSKIPQQQKAMTAGVINSLDTVAENIKLSMNQIRDKYFEMEEVHILNKANSGGEDSENSQLEFPAPTTAIVGIAGELVSGISVVVNYEREDNSNKEITESEAKEIIEKISEQVISQGKEEIASQFGYENPDQIEVLHITVTGYDVDGNSVEQLEGFRGSDITIYLHASFAPRIYKDAVDNLMKKVDLKLISLVSQPFSVARAFSRDELSQGKIIFVDVGGGTTDVAVAQGTAVVDTKMFAFGGRVFTKRLSKDMNIDFRHAEVRKLKYGLGELDQQLIKKVRESLKKDIQLWVEGLRSALEMVEDIEYYPEKIYLCGGGSLLPDLKETINMYPWKEKLSFRKHPTVKIITPTVLDNVYDKSGDLKAADDVTPASLARFAWDIATNSTVHIRL